MRGVERRCALVLDGGARRPAVVLLGKSKTKARLDVIRMRGDDGFVGAAGFVEALMYPRDVGNAEPGFDQLRIKLQRLGVERLGARKRFAPSDLAAADFRLHDP